MIDLFSLFSIGLAFFAIAVSPGPANISNATIAMSQGRKTSLVYGAGLSTGLVFWGGCGRKWYGSDSSKLYLFANAS
jgi:threonine efflux protein